MTKELSKYGKHAPGSEKALKMQEIYDQRLKEFRQERQKILNLKSEEEKGVDSQFSKNSSERGIKDLYSQFTKTIIRSTKDESSGINDLQKIFDLKYKEFYSLFCKLRQSGYDDDYSDTLCFGVSMEINPDREEDKEAIREMKRAKMPPFRRLNILTMEKFTEEEKLEINEFFENVAPKRIKYLTLNTGSHAFDDLDIYIDSLCPLLECVTEEIFLHAFTMSPETLSRLISSSHQAKRLIISWCKCQTTDTYEFEIDTENEYHLEYLNIFWTCYNGGPGHLNNTQFANLVNAMGKTNMVDTLKHVGSGGDYYNTTALTVPQLTTTFSDAGFSNVSVQVSQVQP